MTGLLQRQLNASSKDSPQSKRGGGFQRNHHKDHSDRAFVEILPGKEGMIHISQLSEARVEKVDDVVKVGDEVTVRIREIDNRGRINLTLRGVPQNGEETQSEPAPTPVAPLN